MTFRYREAARVFALREHLFSGAASESIRGQHHLSAGFETENIYFAFRDETLDFFRKRKIKWHSEPCDTSIVSSQVSCLNCLFPYTSRQAALRCWLSRLYPDLDDVIPISSAVEPQLDNGQQPFVTFEWIGERNHLNEPRWGRRGQGCTSVDAVVRFRRRDARTQIVLIEWKYCEEEGRDYIRVSKKGTDRAAIYEPHLRSEGCQIQLGNILLPDVMFVPFDQLMRLQLLASAMERSREMAADIVSVLHIAPRANDRLMNPELSNKLSTGKTVGEVWRKFTNPDRFQWIASEDLVPLFVQSGVDSRWAEYIATRYGAMPLSSKKET